MLTVLELLEQGRAIIADPARWTQGMMARDERGRGVMAGQKQAVCFCSLGALRHIVPDDDSRSVSLKWEAHRLLSKAADCLEPREAGTDPVAWLNDHYDHTRVLQMWDWAIRLAKKSGHGTH